MNPQTNKKTRTGKPNAAPRRGGTPTSAVKSEAKKKNWADPEWAAMVRDKIKDSLERRKGEGNTSWRLGIPDGMRRWEAENEWRFARMYAKEVTKIMVDKGMIEDDERVTKAFSAAVEVLESPMNQTTKLQAARLILDFLKAKPASKSEVTVQKAEDWLAAVTADALKNESRPEDDS